MDLNSPPAVEPDRKANQSVDSWRVCYNIPPGAIPYHVLINGLAEAEQKFGRVAEMPAGPQRRPHYCPRAAT